MTPLAPHTVGSLTDTITYNSFLAPASNTGPNTDTTSILYVNAAKPYTTTSAYGLTTYYSYTTNTTAAKVNGRWSRTTLDGLGRTIMVENGTGTTIGSGTVNQVDTSYDSCGCSPLGKLKSTSLPHAPGAGAVSTTYTYDGIGRTLSVLAPDGASTTSYSYQGNVVTVTDPAGAWKKYTSDAFGRLMTVEEPNPAGGSYFTTYTYDMLDHLTNVNMARSTGTQTRTFNYIDPGTSKPGALLRSATNPENGTVTYTYDSSNRLWKVTDAKNQQKVMTYDSLSRVTQVQRYYYSGGYVEDTMQRTNFSYDTNTYTGGSSYSHYVSGRLAAVQYYGGNCSSYGTPHTGCDLIQEWYNYNQQGAMLGKKLILKRSGFSNSLVASWTVDSEGRMTNVTYPSWQTGPLAPPTPGSSYTYTYDAMGRLNTMTDTVNSRTLISGMTYGVANEVLQLTAPGFVGVNSETRTYNSMFELTRIQVPSLLDITYSFSPTQNNGKITSQTDALSGEQVLYTYDSLNRLASAQTTGTGGWGQSYTYDGFGNLTDQTLIKGTAPDVHVAYDYSTNRQTGETADANGNIGAGYNYDMENRLVQPGSSSTARYAYDAANKRVWRGDSASGLDEISFWAGHKLATYQIGFSGTVVSFGMTTTNVYFGSKLISKGNNNITGPGDYVSLTAVTADRLGSIGKFYPFGVERPSATANDKEKFTGYFRDASTGLDYADQRYEQPGMGRFMTPDSAQSAKASNPGSWNRCAYASGDPTNGRDPHGLDTCFYVDGALDSCTPDLDTIWLDYSSPVVAPGDDQVLAWLAEIDQQMLAGDDYLNTAGGSAPTAVNNVRHLTTDLFSNLASALSGTDCGNWFQAGFTTSNLGQPGESLSDFMTDVGAGLPAITGSGDFVGGTANAVTSNTLGPPGYLILVNSGGPFFNGLPMFQSIGISKDYTQQIDAIRGGTEQAQVFLLLHELGHLFGMTRNDNGTTDDKTNQAWNNDALWLNCGSIIQGFSNQRK